jgi:polygalacturonase
MNCRERWFHPMTVLRCFLISFVAVMPTSAGEPATYSVTDHGAVGDGTTLCTTAIQKAIDAAASAGGGTVHFPPGTYLSGTLFLKSHITLNLEAGATLLGSPNLADYPATPAKFKSRTNTYVLRSLIFAEDLNRIAFVGRGTLDGNGNAYKNKSVNGTRPLLFRIINCRDVLVENVRMQNSGFWNQHYQACERVRLRGLRVFSHASYNVDAVDIDGCRDVVVSDCFLDSDDDALCLKSTCNRPCENILVSNCVISSHCTAMKMGTDSSGGFVNVTISNCSIISPRYSKPLCGCQRGRGGIFLELVDGGRMDRIAVSNVTIDGVEVPLFVRLGDRGHGYLISKEKLNEKVPVGTLRNVSFNNIIATQAGKTGCSVVGLPGHCIENVTLSNVSIRGEGGGKRAWASAPIPELPEKYPEGTMFGNLPAHGLYCRHVRGLTLSDVRLETDAPDARHTLVLDDVQDIDISSLICFNTPNAAPFIRLTQTRNVLLRGCRPDAPTGVFLRLEGHDTAGIALIGNDLTHLVKTSEFAEDASPDSLRAVGNLNPKPQ